MNWQPLTVHPENKTKWIWMSNGKEVWLTKPMSSYWQCEDSGSLMWAEIDWPNPPVIK